MRRIDVCRQVEVVGKLNLVTEEEEEEDTKEVVG